MPNSPVDFIDYRYHAVGQGLFASGSFIKNGQGPRFRWVYDCGTVSSPALVDRELDRLPWLHWACTFVPKNGIELVTISHFDADHIGGFAKLLSRHQIDTLLLPYMPLASRIILAFEQGAEAASPLFRLFVDPVGFITSMDGGENIRRIIMVPPANGEAVPPLPDAPDGPVPREPTEISFELTIDKAEFDSEALGDPMLSALPNGTTTLQMLMPGGRLYLKDFWEFVPYNDGELQPSDLTEFRNEVDNQKNVLMDAAAHWRAGSGTGAAVELAIDGLKALYDSLIGGGAKARNIISLFLYSGPLFDNSTYHFHAHFPDREMCSVHANRMAQLFTGDGYLDRPVRLDAMVNYLGQPRLDRVGIFQVMHHGASANWHHGVAQRINPDVSIFSSDPLRKSPGHPSADVLRDFWPFGAMRVDCDQGLTIEFYRHR